MHKIAVLGTTLVLVASSAFAQSAKFDPAPIERATGIKPTGEAGRVIVMGDNVLYEDEVAPAMDTALRNGLEVTGLHNHFFFEEPRQEAVVDGDFAVLEGELQAVLKSLRGAGIHIVAIHQHMTGDEPRLMFLHYWGQGKTQNLAKAVRAAIDLTGTTTGSGSAARHGR